MALFVWKNADELNEMVFSENCCKTPKYVLLLTKTNCFNAKEDVLNILNLRNKPFFWILNKFKHLRVKIEYFTISNPKEKKIWGPLANEISEKICLRKLKNMYFNKSKEIIFIGPSYLKKKFPDDIKLVSLESFINNILYTI